MRRRVRGSILLLTASVATPMHTFRNGLLEGRSIALAGGRPEPIKALLAILGARLQTRFGVTVTALVPAGRATDDQLAL